MTLAALYGADGGAIGADVAERLGVPFLDREIPASVAERTGVPEDAVEPGESRSLGDRVIGRLARAGTVTGDDAAAEVDRREQRLRGRLEEVMAQAGRGGGVVIGRGGMVVLRSVPHALHVCLRGSPEARVRQAMELEGVDRQTAEERQQTKDRARIGYVSRAYGVDGEDATNYHLVIDSTEIGHDACVDLIVAASQNRAQGR